MATYGTDMVVLATGSDGESGTWTEFTGWASGGTPAADTENFIQGTQSQSQTFGNPTTGKSICFDAGSDISSSIPTGDVVIAWVFMGAATNMYGYASGGHRFGIGTSVANFDMWYISGDDRPPNPYGGWWSIAVDPRVSTDATGGTGSAGAWQFFGSLIGGTTLGIRNKIGKGNPHAVDGMRMGRGEIYAHGTGGTFTLMAAANDAVSARWGLFQDTGGGTFRWKGLMSLGITATALTLTDSNKSILIEDMAKVTSTFNKIEFNHVDTDITWTNISITSLNTVSLGDLEMIANCTLDDTGGVFTDMNSFIYQSGATITGRTYRRCGLVTQDGATFDSCTFDEPSGSVGMLIDDADIIDDCDFISDGTGYSMELDSSMAGNSYTMSGCSWTGYAATDGSTGNECIYNNITGSDVTIAVGTGQQPTVHDASTSSTIITSSVPLFIKVKDAAGANIQNAQVYIATASGGTQIINQDTDASGEVDTGYTLSTPQTCIVWIRKGSSGDDPKYKPYSSEQTIESITGLSLTVTLQEDPYNNATT